MALVLLLTLAALDLNEIATLPPLWRARALLHHIEQAELQGPEARDLARQAYTAATSIDPNFPLKNYPLALARLGPPEVVAARAWHAFEKHRGDQSSLPFPERLRSTPATCAHAELDHAKAYLVLAREANAAAFGAALLTLRSPLEIEEGLEALKPNGDPAAAVRLIRRLRAFQDSRREADAAIHLGTLVRYWAAKTEESVDEDYTYYESRLASMPRCAATRGEPEQTFGEVKRLLLDASSLSDYEFTELLLKAISLASDDRSLLDELEAAGNPRIRILTQALRPR